MACLAAPQVRSAAQLTLANNVVPVFADALVPPQNYLQLEELISSAISKPSSVLER